jgi:ribose transport system permease protein
VRCAVLIAWLIEIAIFTFLDPHTFLTASDFQSIAGSQGSLLVLAVAVVPTLSVGEIDLSVASVMTISAVIVGQWNGVDHKSLWSAIVLAMAAAVGAGLVNGLVTVCIGVQGIIVTLGMGTFLLGIAEGITHDLTVGGISSSLESAMNSNIGGISASFYYAVVVTIGLWYVFRHTPLGRRTLFIGRNSEAARLSGVKVARLRVLAFVTGATLAGFAGIISVGVTGGLEATSLQPLLLPAFAAAFVGSVIFTPGQVNAPGTFVAVLFLATGIAGLELKGLSNWVEDAFYGAALVVAVIGSRLVYLRAKRRATPGKPAAP